MIVGNYTMYLAARFIHVKTDETLLGNDASYALF